MIHLLAQKMGSFVSQFSRNHQIVCLQEVHGEDAEIRLFLSRVLPGWHLSISAFYSEDGCPHPDTGGVVIAISPFLSSTCIISETIIVPGRCVAASILKGTKSIDIVNVHNFGLSLGDVHRIGDQLNALLRLTQSRPTHHFAAVLGSQLYCQI